LYCAYIYVLIYCKGGVTLHCSVEVWKKYGALDYKECAADDLNTQWGMSFPKLLKLKAGETVIFSYVVYKSRKHRDSVNKKVMKEMMSDPAMNKTPMPFDMKRMMYGGFKIIVDI
jgi:uncharacterized protein YbaA (DUF1428 family)